MFGLRQETRAPGTSLNQINSTLQAMLGLTSPFREHPRYESEPQNG